MKKLGRNDACKCGSGKKYKICCLSNIQNMITIKGNTNRNELFRHDIYGNNCEFFHMPKIPKGAFLISDIDGNKHYIIDRITRPCRSCMNEHIHLVLDDKTFCTWCDEINQYVWASK